MPPDEPPWLAPLWDMRRYAQTVSRLTAGKSLKDYLSDEGFRLAIERAISIIGEAASQVPASVRERYPDIEWRRIVGLRHILVHEYAKIDDQLLWEIATESVAQLEQRLDAILSEVNE